MVGASLAGLRAVEALREVGHDGSITWIGAEPHLPYDRPPLSKQLLRGEWTEDRIWLRKPEEYERLGIDSHLGTAATELDVPAGEVHLEDGERLPFDGLIIATGARPRRVPGVADLGNVFYLRTLDDSLALKAAFRPGARMVVIGAGFIGLEIAASAREIGIDVTVIELLPAPLIVPIGPEMAAVCEAFHAAHGVHIRCTCRVLGLVGTDSVEAVALDTGEFIAADIVVVAAGVVPETGWLESSGIALDGGIVCDSFCRTSARNIMAAGDVARWYNPLFDTHMRIEHWTNALEQGAAAARNLMVSPPQPFVSVPYFWSDQFWVRIQFAGWIAGYDEIAVVDGSVDDFSFVALYRRGYSLAGVLTFSRGRIFTRLRRLLASGLTWEEAHSQVEGLKAR